jgi:hypothetical protein
MINSTNEGHAHAVRQCVLQITFQQRECGIRCIRNGGAALRVLIQLHWHADKPSDSGRNDSHYGDDGNHLYQRKTGVG